MEGRVRANQLGPEATSDSTGHYNSIRPPFFLLFNQSQYQNFNLALPLLACQSADICHNRQSKTHLKK
jgi:hypothetical protein